jgi:hypothetical protein
MSLPDDGFDLAATANVLASLQVRKHRIALLQEQKRDLYGKIKQLQAQHKVSDDPESKVDVELFPSLGVTQRLKAAEALAILSKRMQALEAELEREEDEKEKEEEQTAALPDWLTDAATSASAAVASYRTNKASKDAEDKVVITGMGR